MRERDDVDGEKLVEKVGKEEEEVGGDQGHLITQSLGRQNKASRSGQ